MNGENKNDFKEPLFAVLLRVKPVSISGTTTVLKRFTLSGFGIEKELGLNGPTRPSLGRQLADFGIV